MAVFLVVALSTALCTTPVQAQFIRGDFDGNDNLNLVDALGVLNYLFLGGAAPDCLDRADVNDDGNVMLSDALGLLNYLFVPSAATPALPFPDPGSDPTPDTLAGNCDAVSVNLPFEQVELGTFSSAPPQETIIRDGAAWTNFYATHSRLTPTLPPVDFPNEMVIVLVRSFTTGGYIVEVEDITVEGTNIVVSSSLGVPMGGCAVTMALTQPFHFVRCQNVPGTLVVNETIYDSCP